MKNLIFFAAYCFLLSDPIWAEASTADQKPAPSLLTQAHEWAGRDSKPETQAQATKLYRKSADQSALNPVLDPKGEAAFSVAYRLFIGIGTEKNTVEAQRYFEQAATKNHPAALVWLGMILSEAGEHPRALLFLKRATTLNAPGAADRWAESLLQAPLNVENLQNLSNLVSDGQPKLQKLEADKRDKILAQDFLPLLSPDQVLRLQNSLLVRGHDPQGLDGQLGPKTKAALSAFLAQEAIEANPSHGPRLSLAALEHLNFLTLEQEPHLAAKTMTKADLPQATESGQIRPRKRPTP